MSLKTSRTGLGLSALAAALAGAFMGAPGAWGLTASWGAAAVGLSLLDFAWSLDEQSRRGDGLAEEAFARGEKVERASRSGLMRRGAALSLAAAIGLLLSAATALGCFAWGMGWGLLALAPLAGLAYGALRSSLKMEANHG